MDIIKTGFLGVFLCANLIGGNAFALFPPTAEEIGEYKNDGSFEQRKSAALELENHIGHPSLINNSGGDPEEQAAPPPGVYRPLPSTGNVKMLVLLIDFSDHPSTYTKNEMVSVISGSGGTYPMDSLKNYYARASYSKLNLSPNVLGWYRPSYPRSSVPQNRAGRQNLIKEAIYHYNSQGHNFAQYDNDNDGYIDYIAVYWTGPDNGWGDFWWGYSTAFYNDTSTVDGKRFGRYTWQWESSSPTVLIHETGHALGLPDLYDYYGDIGPNGGVGGLDIMGGHTKGDHNAYFKWVLDWTTPK